MDIKVVKFGGSSLSCAEQMKKVRDIVFADKTRRYVVPSAPGKRFKGDNKVTDLLLSLKSSNEFDVAFAKIKERYDGIISGLELDISLDNEYKIIEANLCKGCSVDYIASRGEYLNGILLANYLGYEFIDAAECIFFDENGVFNSEKTNDAMAKRLSKSEKAVIPGFYGVLPDGNIKTFSRGGSDITGAIVSRAVGAMIYENWTDVSGFMMCDPRIVENPRSIRSVTYNELRELSYMGATVLHEDAIFPVKLANIPINIKNTNAPEDYGTMIIPKGTGIKADSVVTGIAGKKELAIIHIEKDMMNREVGFGMRVLSVLADMNIPFEHLPSGIDTMSVVVNEEYVVGRELQILGAIRRIVSPDSIDIETGIALIAVVGRGMVKSPGTAARLFAAAARENINIRMIDQGSSELNIIIGIDEKDFAHAIKTIYEEFAH